MPSSQSPTSVNSPHSSSSREASSQRKEVDYYLNPTELFRWINYRRWDGAKTRVLSHPDECSTWIVSRHSSDGRILWRHLPLHLVCMQTESSGGGPAESQTTTKQIEDLVDALLEAYPDAANSPDDQGMLPLHLTLANSAQPNERILNLLLMAFPTGVDVKDKYGRTPVDIVNEKAESGPLRESALRAMSRARQTTDRMVQAVREETAVQIASVKQSSSNERMASQRIIMRLEEELESVRKQLEDMDNRNRDGEGSVNKLNHRIEQMKRECENSQDMISTVKRERDELVHQNEILRNQVDEHETIVNSLHQEFGGERQEQTDLIAQLKSEVSTAKAMAEALESQLRSRFTNEEYLTSTVSDLEQQLSDLKTAYQQETSKLMHDRDAYETENTQLKRTVEDLSKKSTSLQSKLTAVNKQMSSVLSSHGALNGEHDRMVSAAVRAEADIVETMRAERSQVLDHVRAQWKFFESAMREQEQTLQKFQQKEVELLDFSKEERDRSLEVIANMRRNFEEARASALERNRLLQTDNLFPNAAPAAAGVKSPRNLVESNKLPGSKAGDIGSVALSKGSSRRMMGGSISTEQSLPRTQKTTSSVQKSSSTYSSRTSRPPAHPIIESRAPTSTDLSSGERRQGPVLNDQMDGNLLHLLETRADQGSSRHQGGYSGAESTSYGASTSSSVLSSTYQKVPPGRQKPRMINVANNNRVVNFDASTTTSSSTPAGNASMSRTTVSSHQNPTNVRKVPTLSIDEYSSSTSSSGSIGESDSDTSSRGGSTPSRSKVKKTNQFSGMAAGLRMGMIRISEDAG